MTEIENKFQTFHSRNIIGKWVTLIFIIIVTILISDSLFHDIDASKFSILFLIIISIFNRHIFRLFLSNRYINWLKVNENYPSQNFQDIVRAIVAQKVISLNKIKKANLGNEIKTLFITEFNTLLDEKETNKNKDLFLGKVILNFSNYFYLSFLVLFLIGIIIIIFDPFDDTNIYKEDYYQKFQLYSEETLQDTAIFEINSGCHNTKYTGHEHYDYGTWSYKYNYYSGGGEMIDNENEIQIFNPSVEFINYPHPYVSLPLQLNKIYENRQLFYKDEMIKMFDYKKEKISFTFNQNRIFEIYSKYQIVEKVNMLINNKFFICWKITATSKVNQKVYNSEFLFNSEIGFVNLRFKEHNKEFKLIAWKKAT